VWENYLKPQGNHGGHEEAFCPGTLCWVIASFLKFNRHDCSPLSVCDNSERSSSFSSATSSVIFRSVKKKTLGEAMEC
jgi:hypothetical protein